MASFDIQRKETSDLLLKLLHPARLGLDGAALHQPLTNLTNLPSGGGARQLGQNPSSSSTSVKVKLEVSPVSQLANLIRREIQDKRNLQVDASKAELEKPFCILAAFRLRHSVVWKHVLEGLKKLGPTSGRRGGNLTLDLGFKIDIKQHDTFVDRIMSHLEILRSTVDRGNKDGGWGDENQKGYEFYLGIDYGAAPRGVLANDPDELAPDGSLPVGDFMPMDKFAHSRQNLGGGYGALGKPQFTGENQLPACLRAGYDPSLGEQLEEEGVCVENPATSEEKEMAAKRLREKKRRAAQRAAWAQDPILPHPHLLPGEGSVFAEPEDLTASVVAAGSDAAQPGRKRRREGVSPAESDAEGDDKSRPAAAPVKCAMCNRAPDRTARERLSSGLTGADVMYRCVQCKLCFHQQCLVPQRADVFGPFLCFNCTVLRTPNSVEASLAYIGTSGPYYHSKSQASSASIEFVGSTSRTPGGPAPPAPGSDLISKSKVKPSADSCTPTLQSTTTPKLSAHTPPMNSSMINLLPPSSTGSIFRGNTASGGPNIASPAAAVAAFSERKLRQQKECIDDEDDGLLTPFVPVKIPWKRSSFGLLSPAQIRDLTRNLSSF